MVKTTSKHSVGNVSVHNNTTVVMAGDSCRCQRHGCETPTDSVKQHDGVGLWLCRRCRQSATQRLNAQLGARPGSHGDACAAVRTALLSERRRRVRRVAETTAATRSSKIPGTTSGLLDVLRALSATCAGLASELAQVVTADATALAPQLAVSKASNDKLLRFYDVCEQADIITYRVDGEVKSRHCVWTMVPAASIEDTVLILDGGPTFTARQLLTGRFDRSTYRMSEAYGSLSFGISTPIKQSASLSR